MLYHPRTFLGTLHEDLGISGFLEVLKLTYKKEEVSMLPQGKQKQTQETTEEERKEPP